MDERTALAGILLLGSLVGAYLVFAGATYGLRRQRIEIHNTGRFLEGRAAVVRGAIYIVLGVVFVIGFGGSLLHALIRGWL